jgi:hypothetical protein
MKGIGWIVMVFALLAVTYLVVQDLGVLRGERQGQVVMEPMERAKETAELVRNTQDAVKKAIEKADRE